MSAGEQSAAQIRAVPASGGLLLKTAGRAAAPACSAQIEKIFDEATAEEQSRVQPGAVLPPFLSIIRMSEEPARLQPEVTMHQSLKLHSLLYQSNLLCCTLRTRPRDGLADPNKSNIVTEGFYNIA